MSSRGKRKKRIGNHDTKAMTVAEVPQGTTITASDVHPAHQEVAEVETTEAVVRAATTVDMAVAAVMTIEAVIMVAAIDIIAQVATEEDKGIESLKQYN